MGPQTSRIPSLRTESACVEQCLQTDGFWEGLDQSRQSVTRQGVCPCLAGALGQGEAGFPRPVAPTNSWNQDLQTQAHGALPGTQILGKPRLTCPGALESRPPD